MTPRYDLLPQPTSPRVITPELGEQHTKFPIKSGDRRTVTCDVIIPYRTDANWTITSVESILNQNYAQPIIHIVGDDPDPSAETELRRAFVDITNIRWYRTKRRLGQSIIINCLFDYMETPYFAIQDNDDIAAPNRLWRSISILEDGYDMFGAAMEQFIDYRRGGPTAKRYLRDTPYHVSGVHWIDIPYGAILHGTMAMRRSLLERLNGYGELISSGDCELINRAYIAGAKVYISDQVVAWRRLHDDSVSLSTEILTPEQKFTKVTRERCFAEWKVPGCDLTKYGYLDRYRSGDELIRL